MLLKGSSHTFMTAQAREERGATASKGLSKTVASLQLHVVVILGNPPPVVLKVWHVLCSPSARAAWRPALFRQPLWETTSLA